MLPWVYGFTWQTGNVIFLTIFYAVVAVVLTTLTVAAARALLDLRSNRLENIRWHVDFKDLSDFAKLCRHVFTQELSDRVCHNGFDCRSCGFHKKIMAGSAEFVTKENDILPLHEGAPGLKTPTDRMYHRGHTWVRKEQDGTLTVGLDEFAEHIIGESMKAELPKVGTVCAVHGTGWYLCDKEVKVRVLSPVDGEVVEVGGRDDGFYLKIKPARDADLRHLLRGGEVEPWLSRELERLEMTISSEKLGISLADGGELMDDFAADHPEIDRDKVLGEMLLDP